LLLLPLHVARTLGRVVEGTPLGLSLPSRASAYLDRSLPYVVLTEWCGFAMGSTVDCIPDWLRHGLGFVSGWLTRWTVMPQPPKLGLAACPFT